MKCFIDFFSQPFFIIAGGILNLIVLAGLFYAIFSCINGILPALIRLGFGLSNRKIAIFGGTKFNELKSLLIDSGMFKEKNIIQINKNEIKKAADMTLMLVYWKDFSQQIDEIIAEKAYSDALIIYAPIEEGKLLDDDMKKINSEANSIVVNFRGRLLNDITSCMVTTAYKK
jgi:hypothetical protein